MRRTFTSTVYKVTFFHIIFFIGIFTLSFCQESNKIKMEKAFLGYKYYYGVDKLSRYELNELLEMVPSAQVELKSAKQNQTFANIFGYTGGFLIGWPVGEAIVGKESPNWHLAVMGGLLIIPAYLLESNANNHYKIAVNNFNNDPPAIRSIFVSGSSKIENLEPFYYNYTLKSGKKIQGKLLCKKLMRYT